MNYSAGITVDQGVGNKIFQTTFQLNGDSKVVIFCDARNTEKSFEVHGIH
jgi:hypothetical protein